MILFEVSSISQVIHKNFLFLHAGLQLLSSRFCHHHLTELIKVHCSASILVYLVDDAVKIFLCQLLVELPNYAPEDVGGDVTQAVLVIEPARQTKVYPEISENV